jgi:hypothetical protein
MPSRPFSMMRKNGSSALKSSRSVIAVVMMGPVYVHACAVRAPRSRVVVRIMEFRKWPVDGGE